MRGERGPVLRRKDADAWSRRIPTPALAVFSPLAIVVVVALGGETTYPSNVAGLFDAGWMLRSVASGAAMLIAVAAWWAPRLALATTTSMLAWFAITDRAVADAVAGGFGLLLLCADAALRRRQRDAAWWLSPRYARRNEVRVDRVPWGRVQRWTLCGAVVLVALAAVGVGAAHVRPSALAERGVERAGQVVSLDPEFDEVTVEYDGRRYVHTAWPDDFESLAVGEPIPLIVDPRGEVAPYPVNDPDPDGNWEMALVLGGAALGLIAMVAAVPYSRRRLLLAVATTAPSGVVLRARWRLRESSVELFAHDDPEGERPFAVVSGVVVAAGDPLLLEGRGPAVPQVPEHLAGMEREARWVSAWQEIEREVFARPLQDPTIVRAYGLACDGSVIILRLDGGLFLAGTRPVRGAGFS